MKMRSVVLTVSSRRCRMLLVTAAACLSGPVTRRRHLALIGPDAAASATSGRSSSSRGRARATRRPRRSAPTASGRSRRSPSTEARLRQTRFVVVPAHRSRRSSTARVVVEWLNVSAGGDIPTDWLMAHNEFIRSGAAYVGVSAQPVGVDPQDGARPTGTARSSHPGDSYSYDIFTQAGQRSCATARAPCSAGSRRNVFIATG